jgi:hypothetical protein
VLKDPDYVSNYHRGTLSIDTGPGPQPIVGAFRNVPQRAAANKPAVLKILESRS